MDFLEFFPNINLNKYNAIINWLLSFIQSYIYDPSTILNVEE